MHGSSPIESTLAIPGKHTAHVHARRLSLENYPPRGEKLAVSLRNLSSTLSDLNGMKDGSHFFCPITLGKMIKKLNQDLSEKGVPLADANAAEIGLYDLQKQVIRNQNKIFFDEKRSLEKLPYLLTAVHDQLGDITQDDHAFLMERLRLSAGGVRKLRLKFPEEDQKCGKKKYAKNLDSIIRRKFEDYILWKNGNGKKALPKKREVFGEMFKLCMACKICCLVHFDKVWRSKYIREKTNKTMDRFAENLKDTVLKEKIARTCGHAKTKPPPYFL